MLKDEPYSGDKLYDKLVANQLKATNVYEYKSS